MRKRPLLVALAIVTCAFAMPARAQDAQNAPAMMTHEPACPDARSVIDAPCVLNDHIDPNLAVQRIGQHDHAWWLDGDQLTMVARPTQGRWVMMCCAVQTPLVPIPGTGMAGVTVRIPRIREAILDIRPIPSAFYIAPEIWRGPDAPPPPPRAPSLAGTMTIYDFPSKNLGETRRLSIYVPSGVPAGMKLPVFYLADGLTSQFAPLAEAAVSHGKVRAAILVGIDAAKSKEGCLGRDCDNRGMEYMIDANNGETTGDNPFTRHLRFVTEEVVPYVEAHFPASAKRQDRAIGGTSNGGDWAIVAAALHPELFGNVMAFSVATNASVRYSARLKTVRMFGAAGLLEPTILATTDAAVAGAKATGAETRTTTLVAGHGQAAWDVMFVEAEAWLFPGKKS